MPAIRRRMAAHSCPFTRRFAEVEMPTSPGSLPRRPVLVLALGLTALGALEILSRGGAPRAQTPPQAAAPGGFDFAGQREEVFKAFYSTGLDTSTAYTVSNLVIKKDTMTLLLKQGTVLLMKPIGGEVTGGAFIGDGEASMTPPNKTQRFMLNKYYGAEALKEPFTESVFRFSDGSDRTIRALGKGGAATGGDADHATQILRDRNGWLDGTRQMHLEMQLLEHRISGLNR